jgi:glyoxylase-like metal-dependent hydrolase (beta-lactamase superfamily II)
VYGVLSTHHHNDHHGLAGRVREVSGVAERMEWSRPWTAFSVHTRCTALTEARAHLRHLEVRGLLLHDVRGRLSNLDRNGGRAFADAEE